MKYQIIYADPPWRFETWSEKGQGFSPQRHYDCMSLEEIKKLGIPEIAAKDSVLIMWAIFPMLPHALELIESWGFTYKTVAFTWIKTRRGALPLFIQPGRDDFAGLGYYTRANAEIALLATKGKPLSRISNKVRQVVFSPLQRHSKKPPEIRDMIVELFGDLPRVELFARQKADGWDSWGNEIETDLEL